MAYSAGIEREGIGRFPQTHGTDMIHRMMQSRVYIVQKRTCSRDEFPLAFESEAIKRRHIEMTAKFLCCGIKGERPPIGVVRAENLGWTVAGKRIFELNI